MMKNQLQNQPVRAVDRRFSTIAFKLLGYTISQSHGVIREAVFGAFAALGGRESSVYIETAEKARETAFIRLLEHAATVGGNAVVGVHIDKPYETPKDAELVVDLSTESVAQTVRRAVYGSAGIL
ncbi:hypothetical protein BG015_001010 [Linnemannia schmuckeri]|uniref:Uncharacterized protein n=1 Tax=Linnemannia schmuckeri TaxID=64567 RepID=A0A9P5RTQ4_9FUNG|nr:hypothetical protein BG015_001010 [Linnemannia schmuckeri]